jgi:hypothetical protein
MENGKRLQLIVSLTMAKVEILNLKADEYNWQVHTDNDAKQQLLQTLLEIDEYLLDLKTKPKN